jgi:ankyrin repeat protein
VKLLLAEGADIDRAFEEAISRGKFEVISALLNAGADLNGHQSDIGHTALSAAVANDVVDTVAALISAGGKVNKVYPADTAPDAEWVTNALPIAAKRGNIEIVQLLLDAGAEVDASTMDFLGEDKEEYPSLTRRMEDEEDTLGRTALLSAVRYVKDELVNILLNAGANVNARPQPFGG